MHLLPTGGASRWPFSSSHLGMLIGLDSIASEALRRLSRSRGVLSDDLTGLTQHGSSGAIARRDGLLTEYDIPEHDVSECMQDT